MLNAADPCTALPHDSDLARRLMALQTVIVDARCDNEEPKRFIGVYGEASQDEEARVLGEVGTGRVLLEACRTQGDPIDNYRGLGGRTWVRFDYGGVIGYVPGIWTQTPAVLPQC